MSMWDLHRKFRCASQLSLPSPLPPFPHCFPLAKLILDCVWRNCHRISCYSKSAKLLNCLFLLFLNPPFSPSLSSPSTSPRVRVVGLDNFHGTDLDVVYLEAGVYHGGELLGSLKFTTESVPSVHPRWNQWITFDMPVRMLPKAARLCFQVVGGVRSRDSRKRNTIRGFTRSKGEDKKSEQHDRPLNWVNMQILDHRY